jgi:hypothetical protein
MGMQLMHRNNLVKYRELDGRLCRFSLKTQLDQFAILLQASSDPSIMSAPIDETYNEVTLPNKTAENGVSSTQAKATQSGPTIASQDSMIYKRLGRSGLKVSQVILGCMGFGSPEWAKWVVPEEK